jgi:hypothetical protein
MLRIVLVAHRREGLVPEATVVPSMYIVCLFVWLFVYMFADVCLCVCLYLPLCLCMLVCPAGLSATSVNVYTYVCVLLAMSTPALPELNSFNHHASSRKVRSPMCPAQGIGCMHWCMAVAFACQPSETRPQPRSACRVVGHGVVHCTAFSPPKNQSQGLPNQPKDICTKCDFRNI